MRHLAWCVCVLVLASGCSKSAKPDKNIHYGSVEKKTIVTSETDEQKAFMAGCPPDMVLIPAGPMLYGPNEEKGVPPPAGETAQRMNVKAFCVDRYEYPNQPGEAPMRLVTYLEAQKLCSEKGKRLCSEYEFEKACRGGSGTLYTYGDGFANKACPNASEDYGAGQFTDCVSGFGVNDMSGGVYEWTSSTAGSDDVRILRGGLTSENADSSARCTYRVRYSASKSAKEIGFRCCASPSEEKLAK